MVGLSLIPCLGSAKKNQEDESSSQRPSWTCFNVMKVRNPVSRFRLGRRAAKVALIVAELSVSGENLLDNDIAHYPPNYLSMPTTPYQMFDSRQEAYEKLWNALVDKHGHPVLGIYGMPGVGKSRMMEQAYKEAKDKKIFNTFTRANVGSKKIDVVKLQGDLANCLNCPLAEDDVVSRASKLKSSLMKGGKTLIMLDDVWEVIPLKSIGIPFGDDSSKGCKIIFTSRRQDVCMLNNCKDPIEVKTLTADESSEMFKNTVGTSRIEVLVDTNLAKKVCEACRDVPLLIYAVGNQLKFLTENSWKDSLSQLENCKLEQIDGMDRYVYPCLELSFNKLKDGPKTCLLLCSLFGEDADIDIKMLSDLATGSQLLDSEKDILTYIDILKSSCLLLEGKDDYTVKLNGIIRDVAKSKAASSQEFAFLYIRGRSRFPQMTDYSTRRLLQLDLEGDNVGFPADLVCPDLHTLWLQWNNHNEQQLSGIFKGFTNLRSLMIKGVSISQVHLSVHSLHKLRVLILEGCDVDQTFLNSITDSLETLSIRECHLPTLFYLPGLRNLIKLEFLRPLVIKGMSFSQHPSSTHVLDKLRVLTLDGCDVSQTFLNSIPKNLETLSIRDCHLPSPLYLPQLKNLRKLELFSDTQLEIVAETVSSLSSLQEKKILGRTKTWNNAPTQSLARQLTVINLSS